jgi:hypothetical protein
VAVFEGQVMFGLGLFRFRSPERSRKTDERKLAQIWQVVRSAVADAEVEYKVLQASIAKGRRSAVFLVDVDGGESDPNRRTELRRLEQRVLAAEARLTQLRDHLAHLRRIEAATRLPC